MSVMRLQHYIFTFLNNWWKALHFSHDIQISFLDAPKYKEPE